MPRKSTPHPLDIPGFLRVTPAEAERRKQWWIANPPKAMPLFEDKPQSPESAAFREEFERERAERKRQREAVRKENRKPHKDMYYCQRRRYMVYGFPPPPPPSAPPEGISVEYRKLPAMSAPTKPAKRTGELPKAKRPAGAVDDLSRMIQENVRGDVARLQQLAEVNGVWEDKYECISPAQARMTVGNRLRAKWKRGELLIWPSF
jgi:hypothetical protein